MKRQVLAALGIGFAVGIAVSLSSARLNYEVISEVQNALAAQKQVEQLRISIDRAGRKLSSSSDNRVTTDSPTQSAGSRAVKDRSAKAASGALVLDMELDREELEQLTREYLDSAISLLRMMVTARPIMVFVVLSATVSILILKFYGQKQHSIELSKSEQALRSQNDKLEALMRQRERLIATLAHGLKTPLIGADLALAMLLDEKVDMDKDRRVELLSLLRKNNRDVLSKLQLLIQIYRYENPQLSRPVTDANMAQLLQRCFEQLAPIAELQGVTIKSDLAAGNVHCRIDIHGIEHLISSLLDNAVKFSPRDATISLSTRLQANDLQISVIDNGKGISPEDQARLFSGILSTASDPSNQAYGGNGLGLYLAKLVVDAHGGSIDCVSELGKGSTFTVHLPSRSQHF